MLHILTDKTSKIGNHTYRTVIATMKNNQDIVVTVGYDVNVVVKNASHRAFRGAGKFFDTVAEAKANYKSAAIKEVFDYIESDNEVTVIN